MCTSSLGVRREGDDGEREGEGKVMGGRNGKIGGARRGDRVMTEERRENIPRATIEMERIMYSNAKRIITDGFSYHAFVPLAN